MSQVALAIANSQEYRHNEIEQLYGSLLGRPADPSGLNAWMSLLAGGGTYEQLEAGILSSTEYYQRAGGTNTGFFNAIYQDVLGRQIDPSGAMFGNLTLTLFPDGRNLLTHEVLRSIAATERRIHSMYFQALRRSADSQGLHFFARASHEGAGDDQILSVIAASEEYVGRLVRS